jgi:hypothetical protein
VPATLLIAAHDGMVGLPVLLGWARAWPDELSSALALAGFAALLLEFLLSGRFRAISGGIGIDRRLRWHQSFARVLTAALLLHPFCTRRPPARRSCGPRMPPGRACSASMPMRSPPVPSPGCCSAC